MATSDKFTGERTSESESKVGGVVGRIIEALTGEKRTHRVDRDREDAYWREHYKTEPYAAEGGHTYDEYAPAYRTGYEGFSKYEPGTRFEDAEPTLQEDYTATHCPLPWDKARNAARAAWSRVGRGEAFTVLLTEEELQVSKREVESGTVRLRKVVKTETVSQPVELKREDVTVEKVAPTSKEVPSDAFQEGTIEVPLKREEAVVEKTARVTGEVQVKKGEKTETQNVQEQLRKEDVVLEKEGRTEDIERGRDIEKK